MPQKLIFQIDARMLRASGIGTYIRSIMVATFSLGPPELWEVRALCCSVSDANWLKNNCPGIRTLVCGGSYYSPAIWFDRDVQLLVAQADVWWAPHYLVPPGFNGTLFVSIHDCAHLDLGGPNCKTVAAAMLMQIASVKSDKIFTVSQFSCRRIWSYFPGARTKVHAIPNGVSEEWFQIIAKTHYDRPYAVVVGNNKPNKNLGLVLSAFDSVPYDLALRLIVVGKLDGFLSGGTLHEEFVNKFHDSIRFTGEIPFEELRLLVGNASALIMPSKYEGFSLPPLEALAIGTPIVVSDIDVHREYYEGYADFFSPDSPDSLWRALRLVVGRSPDEKLRRRQVGISRAREFDWHTNASALRMGLDNVRKIYSVI